MHVHRVVVVVVVAVVVAVAVAVACSGSAALRAHRDRLRLLELALNRDVQWRPVFERTVLLSRVDPQRRDAYRDTAALRLTDGRESAVAPWPLVRRVVREFAWLGSHVEFAARVLRDAYACHAYADVTALADAAERAGAYRDASSALFRLLDRLYAADPADVRAIADLAHAFAAAPPGSGADRLNARRDAIDATVRARCGPTDRGGMYADRAPHADRAVDDFEALVERTLLVYDGLGLQTVSARWWTPYSDFPVDEAPDD